MPEIIDPLERAVTRCVQEDSKVVGGAAKISAVGQFGISANTLLNNHRLKPVGLNDGLKVRIRVA
jgi:hypothetical protein